MERLIAITVESVIDLRGIRKQFEADCAKLQIQPLRVHARSAAEMPAAFVALASQKAEGLMVAAGGLNLVHRKIVVELAAKHRLPTAYPRVDYVEDGGLFSYAADYPYMYRHAATDADKIFKGARAGELPIDQPLKFELVINTRTARALKLEIPRDLAVRADRVIE